MNTDFVADVSPSKGVDFVLGEFAGQDQPPAEAAEALALDEYSPVPTLEDKIAEATAELEAQFEGRLEQARREDAAEIEALSKEVRADVERRAGDLARHASELALVLAERLVRDRIDRDPEVIVRVLHEAIAGIEEATELTVHAHPEDATNLRALGPQLEALGVIAVESDSQQRRGGCIVRRDRRAWDASLVAQLKALHEAIDRALEAS